MLNTISMELTYNIIENTTVMIHHCNSGYLTEGELLHCTFFATLLNS